VVSFRDSPITIGGPQLAIIVSPCAVTSQDELLWIADRVRRAGARFLYERAHSSGPSRQRRGLASAMSVVRSRIGMLIVVDALDQNSERGIAQYADVIQVRVPNLQDYSLSKWAGVPSKPVLLTCGTAAQVRALLTSGECVLRRCDHTVVLCVSSADNPVGQVHDALELNVVATVRRLTDLPLVMDISHGAGDRSEIVQLSRAAVAIGCDGLIVGVHSDRGHPPSDEVRSLSVEEFEQLMFEIRQIACVLGREASTPFDTLPVEPGTELAAALVTELAPYLATDER